MTTVGIDNGCPLRSEGFATARQWAISLAATIASTYAIDTVATVFGIALVASGLLSDLDRAALLSVLALSYAVWGVGVWVNLKANWLLLEATGTSTNAVSKGAYDLVKRATRGSRARRIAADAGYVGSELLKELPYYVGALGAVLLTDTISANEALIFLAGANLGAALYEYGLAHLVRFLLSLKRPANYSSFDTDWIPGQYLAEYYSSVGPDERETIAFFVESMKDAASDEPVLFFGVGPTLHHVFLAAGKASEIHLGDYLPANLDEIGRWMAQSAGAHDWAPFVRYTLECEGVDFPTAHQMAEREELTRGRVTKLLKVDARQSEPLGRGNSRLYGTVISAYCADSATGDRDAWEAFMGRITGLVRPGGIFITAALRRSRGYVVGGKTFPSANIDENDMRAVLAAGFAVEDTTVEVRDFGSCDLPGYSGIVLARARAALTPDDRATSGSAPTA